jgi:hypothetical protein
MNGLIRRQSAALPGRVHRHVDIAGTRPPWVMPQPAIVAPDAFLDRRLAAERGAADTRARAASTDAYGRLHRPGVSTIWPWPARCSGCIGCVLRCHQERVRMQFVGPGQIARAGHGDRMIITGAAFGDGQIIPAIAAETDASPRPARDRLPAKMLTGSPVSLPALASYSCARMPANAGCFGLAAN